MKTLSLFFLLVGLCLSLWPGEALSQGYDETISWYDINFYKVTSGEPLPGSQFITIKSDTSLTFSWENGTDATPGYITQLIGSIAHIIKITNDPSLWVSGSLVVTRDVILDNGLYELTVDCEDDEFNRSGHSQPIYIDIKRQTARVIINFKAL